MENNIGSVNQDFGTGFWAPDQIGNGADRSTRKPDLHLYKLGQPKQILGVDLIVILKLQPKRKERKKKHSSLVRAYF